MVRFPDVEEGLGNPWQWRSAGVQTAVTAPPSAPTASASPVPPMQTDCLPLLRLFLGPRCGARDSRLRPCDMWSIRISPYFATMACQGRELAGARWSLSGIRSYPLLFRVSAAISWPKREGTKERLREKETGRQSDHGLPGTHRSPVDIRWLLCPLGFWAVMTGLFCVAQTRNDAGT